MARLVSHVRHAGLCALLFACFVVLGALACMTPAQAQEEAATVPASQQLDQARQRMESIRDQLDKEADDVQLETWRSELLKIQAQAEKLAGTLQPQFADVQDRLEQLGTLAEGQKETSDIAEQRAALEKSNRDLDAEIKLARLLSVESAQTAEQISALRRTQFQARLGERHHTVFSIAFWRNLLDEVPRDFGRFKTLGQDLAQGASATPLSMWTWLGICMVMVIALQVWASRHLLDLTIARVPAGRLRRSFRAAAVVALTAMVPGLIGLLLATGLSHGDTLDGSIQALLDEWVLTLFMAGYTAGLAKALLSPDRPSWRLPPIPDGVAQGLSWLPCALGVLMFVLWLAYRLPAQLNLSFTTSMVLNYLAAALMGLAVLAALTHGERLRRASAEPDQDGNIPQRPAWVTVLVSLVWAMQVVGLACLLIGYLAFGLFLITQVVWSAIVVFSTYLAAVLAEDGFSTVLAGRGQDTDAQPRLRAQAAVVLSGITRGVLVLVALVMLVNPFREGPAELLQRLEQLRHGLQFGPIEIRPDTLLQAVLVLVLGLVIVRLLKRWLRTRYLPTTDLDPGMQLSAATLFGYAGVVVALALALSVLGVSLERVAWIASALSVGIGFGLQAVVQNFVSGLLLLAERPVKVGDWVSLGDVEGDIRRINVRATEIQMGDQSTVIVPNSEFITKTVRNVTHGNPLGPVRIRLSMPLDTDAARVRELILESFAAQPDILETPAADVYLEGIENQLLVFSAIGYVSSPRAAYGAKSRVLFDILTRLREAGVPLASQPTTMLLRQPLDDMRQHEPPPGPAMPPPKPDKR